ncbi:hypothetical protein D3C83_120230 [compost metagenome]
MKELEEELADPALYSGDPEKAKRAGQLDKQLAKVRAELDAAMAAWAEVSER